jgi:hypothetical protein
MLPSKIWKVSWLEWIVVISCICIMTYSVFTGCRQLDSDIEAIGGEG